jgi:predicted ferric reductase
MGKPGMFGLMPGLANPTGLALIIIVLTMFVCSLPIIRRRGHFEIFYFTHLLYWAYIALLIVHAPNNWKWLAAPVSIWLAEMLYRIIRRIFGAGKTVILAGILLPSQVTNLIIERPAGFNFSAGDWVFIQVPAVAGNEWHPFTISSAPEQHGTFTLHIRGVGQRTNSLYNIFKVEHENRLRGYNKHESKVSKIKENVRRRVKSVRRRKVGVVEETFVAHLKRLERLMTVEEQEEERMDQERQQTGLSCIPFMRQATIRQYDTRSPTSDEDEDQYLDSIKVHNQEHQESPNRQEKPLLIYVDGPFGAPASNIYRAQHAVLISTGIGVTPFASILQSIMARYMECRNTCPNCSFNWSEGMDTCMFNLKKVDFLWINREQKMFEWFVNMISKLEMKQHEQGGDDMSRFLDIHTYVTSALQRSDMKAVALQMALDLLHKREDRDLVTGLKARTNAGRPNWDKVFTKVREERKGKVTVFFCGNPIVAKIVKTKCDEFGFKFRKETF